jgi:GT2 family glycosyltransferase
MGDVSISQELEQQRQSKLGRKGQEVSVSVEEYMRSWLELDTLKKELADCRLVLSTLTDRQPLIEDMISMISKARNSRGYRFGNLLWMVRKKPLSLIGTTLWWAIGGYRHRGIGLTQALSAPDPLEAILDVFGTLRRESSQNPISIRPGDWEQGHVIFFGERPFFGDAEEERGSQLANALAQQFYRVTYVALRECAPRGFSSKTGECPKLPRVQELLLGQTTPASLLALSRGNSIWIFERPNRRLLPYLHLAKKCRIRTILDLTDNWENHLPPQGGYSHNILKEFVQLCDAHAGASQPLVETLRQLGAKNPMVLPDAADDAVFDPYLQFQKPADFPVGYSKYFLCHTPPFPEWIAWAPIRLAAEHNPDSAFLVLSGRLPNAPSRSNLKFLGPKADDERKRFLACCDAVLAPFAESVPSHARIPSAIFEYLFMNKPLLCNRVEEMEGFPNVYSVSSDEAFSQLCANPPPVRQDTSEFVSRNSWHHRVDRLLQRPHPQRKFSFIILQHNNRPVIGRCLSTLLYHTEAIDAEVIVVDNASEDGGDDYVEKRFPEVKLIRNPTNGCSVGRNLGVAHSSGDLLVFLDSDTWFTSCGFVFEAAHLLCENPLIGALGWSAGWFDLSLEVLGGPIVDYLPMRGASLESDRFGFRSDIAFLSTCGMFVPRSVWSCLDGFDEFYDPTCFEDTDLSFQVLREGFFIAFRDLSGICHQPHQTTKAGEENETYRALFKRNSDYFRKKWSAYPHFFRQLPALG